MKDLLSLKDVNEKKINQWIKSAEDIKKNPGKYANSLKGKVLLMIFEKPSLRTRVSFEVGITSMGGTAVVINTGDTPLGKKESVEDTSKVCARYAHCIMARMFKHENMIKLAENSSVPVINGLTDDYHPVQVLSDLLSIKEKKGKLKGLKLCYLGDGFNNVTHSLILGCAHMGIDISVGCPKDAMPDKEIVKYASKIGKGKVTVTNDAAEAIKDADVVYTDSWMSYHVDPGEEKKRLKVLKPYQVNDKIVKYAKKDFIFMNCLPAKRDYEQTASVIDGPNSIVFDQAENRLHMQKAVMLDLIK